MRLVSHIRKFHIQIQHRHAEQLAGGLEREIIPPVEAQFETGDITAEEVAFAELNFRGGIHGRTVEVDEVTPTSILGRLSTFDTDSDVNVAAWQALDARFGPPREYTQGLRPFDTHKEMVDEFFKDRVARGLAADYLIVTETPVVAPWPKYNEHRSSVDDLVVRVIEDGHSLEQVIAYERQNLNRPDVIAGLENAVRVIAEDQAKNPAEYVTA